ncbi:MFS transporter [Microseira wollei]|uniref:Major facilitator transporter n=1 Tax=Microseira wollei NIES-4236 TaxID=2530354 RepID=A0AAV3XRD6_9CYAN|nr:MFS transporter [Microseira wollei]GET44406.1 major facilitator transporter [Microseira wollei NIES-4236]
MRRLTNNQKVNFILFVSVLADAIGFGLILPLLPFYALKFGASASTITLLFSVYSLLQFSCAPLWGMMSDRFGRRPTLLLSLIGSSFAFLWLSQANTLWMLFGSRILEGIMAASFLLAIVYLSKITTKENRTKDMGVVVAALGLGLCLGPAISSFLVGSDPQHPNLTLPPLFASGLSAIGFIIAFLGLPELIKTQAKTQELPHRSSFVTFLEIFNVPPTGIVLFLSFSIMFVGVGIQPILAIWSNQKLGWGPKEIGYTYIFWGGMAVFVQAKLVGPLTKRFGEANSLFGGLAVLGFGVFLIPFSTNLPLVLGAVTVMSIGFSLCRPLLISLLSQSAGAKRQGEVLGFAESASSLGKMVGPLVAGFAYTSLSPDWSFWSGTIVMAVASIFGWYVATASSLSSVTTKQRQRKIKKLFDLLDHNKNGLIELRDFQEGFQAIADIRNWTPDSSDYGIANSFWVGLHNKMQSLIDTNGDGIITMEEWQEYMTSRLDRDFADSFTKLIDINEDGEDCLKKLKMLYHNYKIDKNQDPAVFEEFDFHPYTHISEDEISEIIDQFMYSDELKSSVNLVAAS